MSHPKTHLPVMAALGVIAAVWLLDADVAQASAGANQLSVLAGPIDKLVNFFTGPYAFGISVLAIVGVGAVLLVGGDLSNGVQRLLYAALAIALVMNATSLMSSLFGRGATVTAAAEQSSEPLVPNPFLYG